jgi:hypothetical protein
MTSVPTTGNIGTSYVDCWYQIRLSAMQLAQWRVLAGHCAIQGK